MTWHIPYSILAAAHAALMQCLVQIAGLWQLLGKELLGTGVFGANGISLSDEFESTPPPVALEKKSEKQMQWKMFAVRDAIRVSSLIANGWEVIQIACISICQCVLHVPRRVDASADTCPTVRDWEGTVNMYHFNEMPTLPSHLGFKLLMWVSHFGVVASRSAIGGSDSDTWQSWEIDKSMMTITYRVFYHDYWSPNFTTSTTKIILMACIVQYICFMATRKINQLNEKWGWSNNERLISPACYESPLVGNFRDCTWFVSHGFTFCKFAWFQVVTPAPGEFFGSFFFIVSFLLLLF